MTTVAENGYYEVGRERREYDRPGKFGSAAKRAATDPAMDRLNTLIPSPFLLSDLPILVWQCRPFSNGLMVIVFVVDGLK